MTAIQNQTAPAPANEAPPVWRQRLNAFWEGTKRITVIFIKTVLAAAAFFMNPTIFSVGFLVGIIWSDQMDEAVNKIVLIWKDQKILMTLVFIGAGFLSLPVTLAAGSFMYAGYLGAEMWINIRNQQPAQQAQAAQQVQIAEA